MENAVDALKIAFGIFIFLIAIAIAVSVIGQARAASDVIFHFNDKTEFYEYVDENIGTDDSRTVGMETIIPTINRYAKEQFAVTIFDNEGKIIVRYDLEMEGKMDDWERIYKNENSYGKLSSDHNTYLQIKERLNQIYKVAGKEELNDITINAEIRDLYAINNKTTVGAPWIGDNDKIAERIKADMTGTELGNEDPTKYNYRIYQGKNLNQYKDKKFTEKFLEITTSGETITEDEYSLETIKGNKKLEIIYIMQN